MVNWKTKYSSKIWFIIQNLFLDITGEMRAWELAEIVVRYLCQTAVSCCDDNLYDNYNNDDDVTYHCNLPHNTTDCWNHIGCRHHHWLTALFGSSTDWRTENNSSRSLLNSSLLSSPILCIIHKNLHPSGPATPPRQGTGGVSPVRCIQYFAPGCSRLNYSRCMSMLSWAEGIFMQISPILKCCWSI